MKTIDREFYMQNTLDVAKNLLGKYIVRCNSGGIIAGRIVETEGYIGPFDKASHSYNNRRTDRNEVMYGPPGYAYVFAIYGMHYCMNIVTADINTLEGYLNYHPKKVVSGHTLVLTEEDISDIIKYLKELAVGKRMDFSTEYEREIHDRNLKMVNKQYYD